MSFPWLHTRGKLECLGQIGRATMGGEHMLAYREERGWRCLHRRNRRRGHRIQSRERIRRKRTKGWRRRRADVVFHNRTTQTFRCGDGDIHWARTGCPMPTPAQRCVAKVCCTRHRCAAVGRQMEQRGSQEKAAARGGSGRTAACHETARPVRDDQMKRHR